MSAEFQAHGALIAVHAQAVSLRYSVLQKALGQRDHEVPVDKLDAPSVRLATPALQGHVDAGALRVRFAPGTADEQRRFVSAVEAALRGEAPAAAQVPGLHFAAVDVETANADWGSICQIGVSKVIDGSVVDEQTWLCKPPASIDAFEPANIAIHGITAEDVAEAMPFDQAFAQAMEFCEDLPLAAHNAQFDMTAFRRATIAADIATPTATFGCSLALARAAKLDVPNHKLPTVAKALGADLLKHHDAGADARACAEIIIALAQRADAQGSFADVMHALGFNTGTLDADRVYPVLRDRSKHRANDVEIEAVSSQQEQRQAQPRQPWAKVATPDEIPEPNSEADPNGNLYGQTVVLSGDFEPYSKGELWAAIANQGATVAKNVTKKTTILVSGPWQGKTSKLKRAEELQAKGQDLAIWSKEELVTQLGLDEAPPF
ncbi:exonuclease domain-containing protein [Corynebacterium gerontici]|uniref:DNA polymerase III PolC-type n=1 Tax=Corynebacterium gerontici TaxID=2079234 RepID=A0A3G6J1B0_9CORY|nr:exonuclease domain-containing protein [Corynebacterium gerontici]AZA11739.1 DNA polymerase III PolC-type [Corynebacterium gerontici]